MAEEQYQSVGGKTGSSQSAKKWEAMRVTSFEGKTVLDLGCNEGYFVEQALNAGAARAIGVDLNASVIELANERVEAGTFVHSDWETFLTDNGHSQGLQLPEKYDVIFMISALHYSSNYQETLKKLPVAWQMMAYSTWKRQSLTNTTNLNKVGSCQ